MSDEVLMRLSELANDVVSELKKLSDEERMPMLMTFISIIINLLNYGPREIASMLEQLIFKYQCEILREAYMQEKRRKEVA